MLFPVILFGAVWADLNRPVSQADMDHIDKVIGEDGRLPAIISAYYCIRAHALAPRVKPGMTEGDVAKVVGHAASLAHKKAPLRTWTYYPLRLEVDYRRKSVCPDGEVVWYEWFAQSARAPSLSDIAALFLPD
jgi:hypothetical protein